MCCCLQEGVYERIENFLQRNRSDYSFSIDVRDKKTGNTPLIWAAKRGHAKVSLLYVFWKVITYPFFKPRTLWPYSIYCWDVRLDLIIYIAGTSDWTL